MIEVKFDELLAPDIEDEAIEVEHLLAEPKNDHASVDNVLGFDNDDRGKCLEMKDVSGRLESALKANNGWLDGNTTVRGQGDLSFGALDGFLDGVDEIEDFHATDGLASPCDDFLLDIEFGGKVSDLYFGPHKGSHFGNSTSESHSLGFSGASNGAIGVSESSTETMPGSEWKNNMEDKKVTCKVHGVVGSKSGCLTTVKDKTCQNSPTSLDPWVSDELDNDFKSTNKREKSYVGTTNNYTCLKQKRTRKPPKRHIDESSDPKPRYLKGRQKNSHTSSKDKHLKTRSSDDHCRMRNMSLASVTEESVEVSIRRGRPKKEEYISEEEEKLESSEEDYTTESEDDSVTTKRSRKESNDRRKNQRMWTLSEITNLVDGISQYGVGRWTDIKRLLFFASTYRTPLDIRDKWRNLLRASNSQKHNGREVKQNQKCPLPNSLLRRVRELAALHPYPFEREPSISRVTPPTPPKVNSQRRNTRRKKQT